MSNPLCQPLDWPIIGKVQVRKKSGARFEIVRRHPVHKLWHCTCSSFRGNPLRACTHLEAIWTGQLRGGIPKALFLEPEGEALLRGRWAAIALNPDVTEPAIWIGEKIKIHRWNPDVSEDPLTDMT